jgi:hypothetical protein
VANSAHEIIQHLRKITQAEAKAIGEQMRRRALREHTYSLRAQEFDFFLNHRADPAEKTGFSITQPVPAGCGLPNYPIAKSLHKEQS